jgi:hypothetical protein
MVGDQLVNGTIPPVGPGHVPIALGVCAPASCNVSEIAVMVESSMIPYGLNNSLSFTGSCYDLKKDLPIKSIAVLAFVGFLVSLVIFGSCIDFVQTRKESKSKLASSKAPLPVVHSIQASESLSETDSLLIKVGGIVRSARVKR